MKHHGNIKSKGDAKGLLHLTNCDELCSHVQIINQVRSGVATWGPYGAPAPPWLRKIRHCQHAWLRAEHTLPQPKQLLRETIPLAGPWDTRSPGQHAYPITSPLPLPSLLNDPI